VFENSYLLRSTKVLSNEVVQFSKDERANEDGFNPPRKQVNALMVSRVRAGEVGVEDSSVNEYQSSPNPSMCSWRFLPLTPSGGGSVMIPAPVRRLVNSLSTAVRMSSASEIPRRSASTDKRAFISSGKYTVVRCMPYIVPYVGSQAYDLFWGTGLRATTIAHRFLDRISGGRLMRRFPGGSQVVWITTLGRKSGQWRTTPLLGVEVPGGWGIAGSNAGQERIPGWVFNVRANPSGRIRVNETEVECTFTEVDGDAARDIFRRLGESWSSYRMYERNIGRAIPVFIAQTSTGDPA